MGRQKTNPPTDDKELDPSGTPLQRSPRGETGRDPSKRWNNWGDYPVLVIVTVFGTVIGIVTWITGTPFFRGLLRGFADPEGVVNLINLVTILAAALLIILYILIHQNRSRAMRARLSRYGYSGITIIWLVALGMIFRSALPANGQDQVGSIQKGQQAEQEVPSSESPQVPTAPVPTERRVKRLPEIPSVPSPIEYSRSWTSIVYVQNIGTQSSAIDYILDPTGDKFNLHNKNVPPGESWVIDHEKYSNLKHGILGGAILSSSQPMYSVVIQNGSSSQADGSRLRLSYIAAVVLSEKLYFPPVMNNYFGVTSGYYIQNADPDAKQFKATFVMDDGQEHQFLSPLLASGQSYWLTLEAIGIKPASDEQGRLGSLVVESDGPLTAVVFEYKTGDPAAVYSYRTAQSSVDGYSSAYIPERGLGKVINLHVINVDSVPIDVEMSYGAAGKGSDCQGEIVNIPPTHLNPDAAISILQENLNFGMNCRPWARLDGTGKFLAYASEANSDIAAITGLSYSAMGIEELTKKLAVPFFADHHEGINSRFDIRASSAIASTTITATFYCNGAQDEKFTLKTKALKIEPSGAYVFQDLGSQLDVFENGHDFKPNSWCSVLVEGSQPLLGYVTESSEDLKINTRVNYDAYNVSE